jgi:hypothetical protein
MRLNGEDGVEPASHPLRGTGRRSGHIVSTDETRTVLGQAHEARRRLKRPPRRSRRGGGTAWLVFDGSTGGYLCYWYAGTNDDHLLEQARAKDAPDAVAWGRLRTSRVRIRAVDRCTYWAGSAPRPDAFTRTWLDWRPGSHGSPAAGAVPSAIHDDPQPTLHERERAGVALAAGSRC